LAGQVGSGGDRVAAQRFQQARRDVTGHPVATVDDHGQWRSRFDVAEHRVNVVIAHVGGRMNPRAFAPVARQHAFAQIPQGLAL
jgi:hypothetical protein